MFHCILYNFTIFTEKFTENRTIYKKIPRHATAIRGIVVTLLHVFSRILRGRVLLSACIRMPGAALR